MFFSLFAPNPNIIMVNCIGNLLFTHHNLVADPTRKSSFDDRRGGCAFHLKDIG